MPSLKIKSELGITKIYLDGKEIDGVTAYTLKDDIETRQPILSLEMFLDGIIKVEI